MKKICVIGSINMDLTAVAEHFPAPGETILGDQFATFPGGKGGNQAVALGRLRADVRMMGKVGGDGFGAELLANFRQNGVAVAGVAVEKGISTGIAVIEVNRAGENHIIVVPGANSRVDCDYIDSLDEMMRECDIFLLQLEIPLETVYHAIKKLKQMGKTIILDPAPAQTLPEDLYPWVDVITPNETEIAILSGMKIETDAEFYAAGVSLLARGVQTVIAKAGKNGAYLINRNEQVLIPGFPVAATDTTAAGDTFNADFAMGLANGLALKDCIRFANAAAALSTTAPGAQSAMPSREQVEQLSGIRCGA